MMRIQERIAQKFEDVSVIAVGPRFCDDVDHRASMHATTRRQSAALHAEFLNGVRKWEWRVYVGECVVVVAAIQKVIIRVFLAAADRDSDRRAAVRAVPVSIILAAVQVIAAQGDVGGPAGKQDEGGRVSSIKREFHDAIVVNDSGDGILVRIHHRCVTCHFHLLADRANFEAHVDDGALIHLQDDAVLDVLFESRRRDTGSKLLSRKYAVIVENFHRLCRHSQK